MGATAIALYLAAMNLIGLGIMCWDKFQARRGGWRVPEKTLMGIAILGGSLGVYAGMRSFRHKTQHPKFSVGVPAIIILQVALAGWLLGGGGVDGGA